MKKIEAKLTVALTAEEVVEINSMIDRETAMEGLPAEIEGDFCRCPKCGRDFGEDAAYCSLCGQKVVYIRRDYYAL